MRRPPNKEVRALHKLVVGLGWSVARTSRGGHTVYRHPDFAGVISLPSTPSDKRWLANTLASIRRFHPDAQLGGRTRPRTRHGGQPRV